MRGADYDDIVYRFNLTETSLFEILNTLLKTIKPDEITIPGQPSPISELIIKDDAVYAIKITIQVVNTNIEETIDLLSIASGCNIYKERYQLILDRCQ